MEWNKTNFNYTYFSIDRKKLKTMVPKEKDAILGQRLGLTVKDCLKLNDAYGCTDESSPDRDKYILLCDMLGIDNKGKVKIPKTPPQNSTSTENEPESENSIK